MNESESSFYPPHLANPEVRPKLQPERQEVRPDSKTLEWESQLHQDLKEIRMKPYLVAELAPEVFLDFPEEDLGYKEADKGAGRRLFSLIYVDKDTPKILSQTGINLDDETVESIELSQAFLADLRRLAGRREDYNQYKSSSVEEKLSLLTEFSQNLPAATNQEPVVEVNRSNITGGEAQVTSWEELTPELLTRHFYQQAPQLPFQLHERVRQFCFQEACQRNFSRQLTNKGEAKNVNLPKREACLLNPGEIAEKIAHLRAFKQDIKDQRREDKSATEDDLRAKQIILEIYQTYVNTIIANQYTIAPVVDRMRETDVNLTPEVEEALNQLDNNFYGSFVEPKQASYYLQRINKFKEGAGKDKESIPAILRQKGQEKQEQGAPEATEQYKHFNAYSLSPGTAREVVDYLFERYGFQDWQAVVEKGRKTCVAWSSSKVMKLSDEERGLVDFLAVIAHENGHVLSHHNRSELFPTEEEGGSGNIRLLEDYSDPPSFGREQKSPGRVGPVAEAAAMRIEASTWREMVDMERSSLPYYFLILQEKEKGADFAGCFQKFLKAYGQREYDLNYEELLADEKKWQKAVDYCFPRTLRIFRNFTPLEDDSGYLPTTKQLVYMTQEVLGDRLEGEQEKLLYIHGIDWHIADKLAELGMIDLDKIKKPQMVVAREIWPEIKDRIEKREQDGEEINIDEIVANSLQDLRSRS